MFEYRWFNIHAVTVDINCQQMCLAAVLGNGTHHKTADALLSEGPLLRRPIIVRRTVSQKVHQSEDPLVRKPVSQKKSVHSMLLIHSPKHFSFTFIIQNPVLFHFSHSSFISFSSSP